MSTLPPSAVPSSAPTEASMISRLVAIFIPVFAVAAGWFAGVIAQAVPGAHLDQNQIVAFMTAAAVSAITAGWKWLQGWRQQRRWSHRAWTYRSRRGHPQPRPPRRAHLCDARSLACDHSADTFPEAREQTVPYLARMQTTKAVNIRL